MIPNESYVANSAEIVSGLTAIESKVDAVDANVDEILLDTNDLQQNQGDWLTATGFSTFDPASDPVANVTLVDTTTTNTDMRGTDSVPTNPLLDSDVRLNNLDATISSRSTFDNSTDEVITDTASRDASKADVSLLGTHADLEVINNGVKKASRLKPHSEDLP
jgi:hypothetical protein